MPPKKGGRPPGPPKRACNVFIQVDLWGRLQSEAARRGRTASNLIEELVITQWEHSEQISQLRLENEGLLMQVRENRRTMNAMQRRLAKVEAANKRMQTQLTGAAWR